MAATAAAVPRDVATPFGGDGGGSGGGRDRYNTVSVRAWAAQAPPIDNGRAHTHSTRKHTSIIHAPKQILISTITSQETN